MESIFFIHGSMIPCQWKQEKLYMKAQLYFLEAHSYFFWIMYNHDSSYSNPKKFVFVRNNSSSKFLLKGKYLHEKYLLKRSKFNSPYKQIRQQTEAQNCWKKV
jgi:hypothetical protein